MKKNVLFFLLLTTLFTLNIYAGAQQKSGKSKTTAPKQTTAAVVDSFSYAIGVNVAYLTTQGISLNADQIKTAINDFVNGKAQIADEKAKQIIQKKFESVQAKKIQEEKQKADAFLKENLKNPLVKEIAPGLQYMVIKDSTGAMPADTSKVKVNYIGTLIDGKEFDNSYTRGQPISFPLNGVIKGWTESVKRMRVGSKWKVFMSSDYGYGDRGAGGAIPGGAALIFTIELLGIE